MDFLVVATYVMEKGNQSDFSMFFLIDWCKTASAQYRNFIVK